MAFLTRRFRFLAALASLFFMLVPWVAIAQEAAPANDFPTGLALAAFIAGIVLSVGIVALDRIAPRTATKVDDEILEWLKRVKPVIDEWQDPKSSSVPPSPTNPSGQAA